MTDEAAALFKLGLDLNNPTRTESVFSVQAGISIRLEIIAKALFQCAWILTGKQTTADFNDLSLALQQRYRYLAERAIATMDPKVRLDTQEAAARETEDWANGPYDPDNVPTAKNIADFAIGSYESLLSGVRIETERGA